MSLQERTRYIRTLKTVSSTEPYRKSYDKLTRKHPDFFWKIHVQNFFFPWHRWYILQFENLLRQVDCQVTVPYWHWSRAVESKNVFRNTHIKDVWFPAEHGLGGNGTEPKSCVADGPFASDKWEVSRWLEYRCLKRAFAMTPELTDDSYVKGLFKFPREKFLCFEYAVRMFLHNDLHNAVGGTMSVDESASAPEFWFHHGFLDKLWSDWQKRGKRLVQVEKYQATIAYLMMSIQLLSLETRLTCKPGSHWCRRQVQAQTPRNTLSHQCGPGCTPPPTTIYLALLVVYCQ